MKNLTLYTPILENKGKKGVFFLTFYDVDNLKLCFLAFSTAKKCLEYCVFNKIEFTKIVEIEDLKLFFFLKEKMSEINLILINKPVNGGECLSINLENLEKLENENKYSPTNDE